MFDKWIRRARPSPIEELESIVRESPDRVAHLVGKELETDQAILLLMALPAHMGEAIFKNLSDERAESFTRKASEIGPLDPRRRDKAVQEFLRRVRQG